MCICIPLSKFNQKNEMVESHCKIVFTHFDNTKKITFVNVVHGKELKTLINYK